MKRELVPYGVNTLVLMSEELEPIAYRMFFNHITEKSRTISTLNMTHSLELDTLRLEVSLPAALEEASLSISALPNTTLSYQPRHSIATSFLLQPYLSENSVIPHEYLNKDSLDRKNRFQLDTRLLLDGYGNYSWDSRVVQEVQLDYAREAGFEISGKIQDADLTKEKQVYLVTEQTRDMAYEDLQNDKTFTSNMNLYQGDSLAITLLGAKGKLRKAKTEVYFDEVLNVVPSPYLNLSTTLDTYKLDTTLERVTVLIGTKVNDRTIVLDEALVKANSKVEKKILLSAVTEMNFIDEDDLKRRPSLLTYLMKFGIKPVYSNGDMILEKITALPTAPTFFVTINGMMATGTELMTMPLSMVNVVVVTTDKNFGYAINIQLKGGSISPEKRNKYVRFLIKNGYARSRSYTEPAYADYESDYFGCYGVLDWKPNVRISSVEPTQINIPVHGRESIQLHIEGIALDGSLIHVSKEINVGDTP